MATHLHDGSISQENICPRQQIENQRLPRRRLDYRRSWKTDVTFTLRSNDVFLSGQIFPESLHNIQKSSRSIGDFCCFKPATLRQVAAETSNLSPDTVNSIS